MLSEKIDKARVALLVDGENLRSEHADRLVAEAARHGYLAIKRIYGNARQINGWGFAPGFRLIHSGEGKNAADLLLSIEAVHLYHTGQVDVIIIGSSDGDFCHLATHLREQGCTVLGAGEPKAPEGFRNCCSHWIKLEAKPEDRDERIRRIIAAQPEGYLIGQVNPAIRKRLALTLSDVPQSSWRKYFEARPESYVISGTAQNMRVSAL